MKTRVLAFAVVLALILGFAAASDSYAKQKQFCYEKCAKYKSIKGECSDYEWVGAKKECCQWKTVNKGKCEQYKAYSVCKKWTKPKTICLGHASKQVCQKKTKEKVCEKWNWKEACCHKGKNYACDKYAYDFICTKFEKSERCANFIFVPKIKCNYKQRCARYRTATSCSKYKKVCRCQKNWKKVEGKHYKGWTDIYYHAYCNQKCHQICTAYTTTKTCTKFEKVKFCKKAGHVKKCSKFIKEEVCARKKKIRFCTKWNQNKFCDKHEKIRVCEKYRLVEHCCDYKVVPYCTKQKTTKKRCALKKRYKKCIKKSPGVKVCAKYEFKGGKKECRKYAEKTVCHEKKKVCVKLDSYHPTIYKKN